MSALQTLADFAAATAAETPRPEPAPPMQVAQLFSLAGKVALLADAGGGGTTKVAELLADAGAVVVLADRDIDKASARADAIVAAGGKAVAIGTDVEDEAAVAQLFADVGRATGRLDILVNAFGMVANTPLHELPSKVWDEVMSLNLRANFLCMREGVKQMMAAGRGGRIVNVTTIGANHPVLNHNEAYGAARLGVTALGRNAALDYAQHGILVNTLLAGAINDKVAFHPTLLERIDRGEWVTGPSQDPARLPFGFGDMADIAAAVLYLVSPAGRYVTGQALIIDGGYLLT